MIRFYIGVAPCSLMREYLQGCPTPRVAMRLFPHLLATRTALRHGLHRNQLYMWRRKLRSGALGHSGALGLDFVPVVAERRSASGTGAIEIEIGGAVLRADAGVDLAFLGRIVRLLKAT